MHSQAGGKSAPAVECTTAADLWERFRPAPRSVTTGCPRYVKDYIHEENLLCPVKLGIDNVLGGAQGLLRGEVTELIGPSASGKTQLCLSSIQAAVKQAGSSVFVLDTSASITANRIADCLTAQGLLEEDIVACLGRVQCHRTFNLFDALKIVSSLAMQREGISDALTDDFYANLKLVVVDSVYDIAAPILGDREMEGQALLSHFSQSLQHLAHVHHSAVLVTNIPAPLPAVGSQRSTTPALGKMWAQTAHTRLLLGHSSCMLSVERCLNHQERDRTVDLVKSRTTLRCKGSFTISDCGLQ